MTEEVNIPNDTSMNGISIDKAYICEVVTTKGNMTFEDAVVLDQLNGDKILVLSDMGATTFFKKEIVCISLVFEKSLTLGEYDLIKKDKRAKAIEYYENLKAKVDDDVPCKCDCSN